MADIVLLVFEGEKTEPQILRSIKQHFFHTGQNTIIHATFDTDIYTLWKEVCDDEYLDLVEIIRDRNAKNKAELEGIKRNDVSQVFLFFDYDGHSPHASDETIGKMLACFFDETENGKLYISYPMVEALKHIQKDIDFKDICVNAKDIVACHEKKLKYKQLVSFSTRYHDLRKLTQSDWHFITVENYKKANFIVNDIWLKPQCHQISLLNQVAIFENQLSKFINTAGKIAVLSAFPFFIVEYFGEKVFIELPDS